ncbi:O-antigen ligase family protein [Candidatus Gottesmanbacteria bacterium]|nr:O-antigen ligase family protein [Candidatus Gottesmanbacteria bacterium]
MKIFNFLIFLILIIFPFGQLTRLPLGIPEVNIYLQDLVVFVLLTAWFLHHLIIKKPFPKPFLTKPIIYYFLAAAISLIYNLPRLEVRETIIASLYLWRWIFYAGVYFVVFDYYETVLPGNTKRFRMGLIYAGVTAAVFGLIQYFLYPDLRNLAYLGWDPHRYRVFGTFFDPGFLGIILVLTLILLIEFLFSHKFAIYYLLFTICYLALALTYSRSSYLAWIAAIGVIAWIKKAPKFFLTVFLLGILTIFLLPRPPGSEGVKLEREESIWGRVRNWEQSITIAKDNPILGVGLNTYRYAQKQYGFLSEDNWQKSHAGAGADSSLLFVLATTGIIGFLAYLWLLYHILIYNIRNPVVFSSIVALLIHSWFLNSLFYPWIMIWMWILVAVKERK